MHLFSYSNWKPTNDQILKEIIGVTSNYTYLTATNALAQDRLQIIPDQQIFANRNGGKQKTALFAEVLRHWTADHYKIASRGEAKTTFTRAIQTFYSLNEPLKEILIQDRSSWLSVLSKLAAQGIDLSQGFPESLREQLVNPTMIDILQKLQAEYYKQLTIHDLFPLEKATRSFLENNYIPQPLIVMEGFTYLTDLQLYFIKLCNKQGADIAFLVPYNADQTKGFVTIDKTYARYGDRLKRTSMMTDELSEYEDIRFLQANLFFLSSPTAPLPMERISTHCYPTREREIMGCIVQLKEWFETEGYTPADVAIVTRKPKEFMEQLQDSLAMNPLYYISTDKDGNQVRKTVEITNSPRLLLLTPVGRFILILYDIWEQNQLQLTAEQMETILASGWLGAEAQDTASIFRAVKHQYFATCQTEPEWKAMLNEME